MNKCNCGLHATNKKCPASLENIDVLVNTLIDMLFLGYSPERYAHYAQIAEVDIATPETITDEIIHMLRYVLQTYSLEQCKAELLYILISYYSSIEKIRENELKFLRKIKNG